jgi:hypothetical protein
MHGSDPPLGGRPLQSTEWMPEAGSAHVVHDDGRRESGGAAVRDVLKALPSARGLALISPELLYRLIAGQRRQLSRLVPGRAKRRADGILARRGAR